MDTERARNPDAERQRGRQTEKGAGRGSEWQPQRTETRQTSHDGGGPQGCPLPHCSPSNPGLALHAAPHGLVLHLSSLVLIRHDSGFGATLPARGQEPPKLLPLQQDLPLQLLRREEPLVKTQRASPQSPCPLVWVPPCPPRTSGDGRLVVTPSNGRSNSMGPRIVRRCRAITRCCSRLQWFSRDRMTG